jgi:hypothetical protein
MPVPDPDAEMCSEVDPAVRRYRAGLFPATFRRRPLYAYIHMFVGKWNSAGTFFCYAMAWNRPAG